MFSAIDRLLQVAPAVLLVLKDDTVFTTPSARREAAFLQKEYQELEGLMVYCSAEVMPGVLNFLGGLRPILQACIASMQQVNAPWIQRCCSILFNAQFRYSRDIIIALFVKRAEDVFSENF